MIGFLFYLLAYWVSFRVIYKAVYHDLYGNEESDIAADYPDEAGYCEDADDYDEYPAYDDEDDAPYPEPAPVFYRHTA
ncbi:MAG: hypothetical protein IK130_02710 [Oscillospiraceae bacterium]|nr:hypothetical protein [Oscillospiraceae bacterium]